MAVDLSPGTLVRVTNRSNSPFTVQWANRKYSLEPSKPTFIPSEAASLWFGDPRSTAITQSYKLEGGGVAIIPDRESEVRRLCVKYGHNVSHGPEIKFLTKTGQHKDNGVPDVVVESTDGEVLPTVLSDPEGETVNPASITVSDQTSLQARVEALQATVERLLANQAHSAPATILDLSSQDELPEDDSIFAGEKAYPAGSEPLDLNLDTDITKSSKGTTKK